MCNDRDKAIQTLLKTYWCASGWTLRPPASEALELAQRAGVMFDTTVWEVGHDDLISEGRAHVRRLETRVVGSAFVASLSTRRLEFRSPLASFAVLQYLRPHEPAQRPCRVCGLPPVSKVDLNVLSFERFKWGGVRHDSVEYAVLDLRWFLREEVPEPSTEDWQILFNVLQVCRSAAPGLTPPRLAENLKGTLPSSKAERRILLDILGAAGILRPTGRAGYDEAFIPYSSRDCPPARFMETAYPACWWRGGDGINEPVVERYFGDFAG